jgi:hypothetical protein
VSPWFIRLVIDWVETLADGGREMTGKYTKVFSPKELETCANTVRMYPFEAGPHGINAVIDRAC